MNIPIRVTTTDPRLPGMIFRTFPASVGMSLTIPETETTFTLSAIPGPWPTDPPSRFDGTFEFNLDYLGEEALVADWLRDQLFGHFKVLQIGSISRIADEIAGIQTYREMLQAALLGVLQDLNQGPAD